MFAVNLIQDNVSPELKPESLSQVRKRDQLLMTSFGVLSMGFSEMTKVMGSTKEAAPSTCLFPSFISVDDKKKQEENIRKLLQTVKALKEEVEAITDGGKSGMVGSANGADKTSDSTSSGMKNLFAMEAIIELLLAFAVKSSGEQSSFQVDIGKVNVEALQYNYDQIVKEMNKHHSFWDMIKDIFKAVVDVVLDIGTMGAYVGIDPSQWKDFEAVGQDWLDSMELLGEALFEVVLLVGAFFALIPGVVDDKIGTNCANDVMKEAGKVFDKMMQNPALSWVGDCIAVATIIISAVTGQVEIAALVAVLFVLTQTGIMNDITEDIANALGGSEAAQIIADVLMIALITIISLGVALPASYGTFVDEAASIAADAGRGIEMTVLNAGEEVEEMEGIAGSARDAVERTKKPKHWNLKRLASITTLGGSMALGSSSLLVDILKAIEKGDDKKWLDLIFALIQMAIAIAGTAIGGYGMVSSFEAEGECMLTKGLKGFGSRFPQLKGVFEEKRLYQTIMNLRRALLLSHGSAQISQPGGQLKAAAIQEQMDKIQGAIALITNMIDVNDANIQENVRHLATIFKSFDSMIGQFSAFALPQEEVAEALLRA